MTLLKKMVVLAVANLVGFAAAVTANHFYPFNHAIRPPNLMEYIWFLGGLLLALGLAVPLMRRRHSARTMAGVAAGLPAISVLIVGDLDLVSGRLRSGDIHHLISDIVSGGPIVLPLIFSIVNRAYVVSIVSAIVTFAFLKHRDRAK